MNNLSRSLEQWANCSPVEMAKMSPAAIQYAFEDAKHDIAVLARQLKEAESKPDKMRKVAGQLFDAACQMYPSATYGKAAMRDALDEYDRAARELM